MVKQHGGNAAGDTVRSIPFGLAFQTGENLGLLRRQTNKSCAHGFIIARHPVIVSLFMRTCVAVQRIFDSSAEALPPQPLSHRMGEGGVGLSSIENDFPLTTLIRPAATFSRSGE